MAVWMDVAWRNRSKAYAVPLTKLQSKVLRVLAAERSPDSYIAGGVALNREGPRLSRDIDIFQDSQQRLESAAEADAKALTEAGFKFSWKTIKNGRREAEVEWMGDRMPLEWVADSAFRFFPAQRDELFGYVLHPADLATNKASAAADRREPRDIVDLVTIHENILPLGAVVCAAVGRFPGQSPEEMLSDITRHSRFDAEEFRVLATEHPVDVPDLHRRIRGMIEDAERFITRIPSDAVGFVFLERGKPVQPDPEALGRYQRHPGATGGVWPSSPEISSAMLERYNKKQNGNDPKP
jgi:Nucleotidyl transferase AbiEii toxin, Type IV TA system